VKLFWYSSYISVISVIVVISIDLNILFIFVGIMKMYPVQQHKFLVKIFTIIFFILERENSDIYNRNTNQIALKLCEIEIRI